jgi:hypothetical protein
MKTLKILGIAAGLATLTACGGGNEANNADANAALTENYDANAVDVNATDLNAGTDLNATDANAADANAANAADANAATNNAQ